MLPKPMTSRAPRPTGSRTSASVHGRQTTTTAARATSPMIRSSKHRIAGDAPVGLLAEQPYPHGVAADAGGQRLVEEGADHFEAEQLGEAEGAAAAGNDLLPAQRQQH